MICDLKGNKINTSTKFNQCIKKWGDRIVFNGNIVEVIGCGNYYSTTEDTLYNLKFMDETEKWIWFKDMIQEG